MNLLGKLLNKIGLKDSNNKSQELNASKNKNSIILQAENIELPFDLIDKLRESISSDSSSSKDFNFSTDCDLSIEKPPLISINVKREKSINEFKELLKNNTLINLYGERGSGRTTFVLQLLDYLNIDPIWINFKGDDDLNAYTKIHKMFNQHIRKRKSNESQSIYYENICDFLEHDSIIVLDNMPEHLDKFQNFLIDFVNICSDKNIKIISISLKNNKNEFQKFISEEFISKELSTFSNHEIEKLLIEYGAPDEVMNDGFLDLLATTTNRNPTLIAAFIRFWRENNWNLTYDEIELLFKKDYAENVRNKYQKLLFETIKDEQTKNLIYRLDLVGYKFSIEEVNIISEIEPEILHPFEKLNNLLDLWIQKDGDNYYISSVIKGLGELNLSSKLQKKEQYRLGKHILSSREISPFEGIRALGYFISAKKYDDAGSLFVNISNSFIKEEVNDDVWGVSSIWYNMPLPKEMSLTLKITIRINQIRLCRLLNKDIKPLIRSLDPLLENANIEDQAFQFYIIGLMSTTLMASEFPKKTHRYIENAIKSIPIIKIKYKEMEELDSLLETFSIHDTVWFTIRNLTTKELIFDWLNMIESLEKKDQKSIYNSDLAPEGCMSISYNLIIKELEKQGAKQDWNRVLNDIKSISDKAYGMGFKLLWGHMVRETIEVLDWKLNNFERALSVAKENLNSLSKEDTIISFLINEIIGRRLYIHNKYDVAVEYFNKALKNPEFDSLSSVKIECNLYLSSALYEIDKENIELSLEYIYEAIKIGKSDELGSNYFLIKALGEAAILNWLDNDIESSFNFVKKGIELLYKINNLNNEWKSLFMIFAHMCGYLSSLSFTGSPPDTTRDGGEYTAPMPGLFISYSDKSYQLYDDSKKDFILIQIIWFAEGLNKYDVAANWAEKVYQILEERKDNDLITAAIVILPYLIMKDEFINAIELGYETFDKVDYPENLKINNLLIPIMFHLYNIGFDNTEKAIKFSRELKEFSQDYNKKFSRLKNFGDLIYDILNKEHSYKELIDFGNSYNKQKKYLLTTICYIGSTLQNCTPKQAINAHLAVYPIISTIFNNYDSANYSKIIKPFFITYWKSKFKNNKFRFKTPRLAEEEIVETFKQPNIKIMLDTINSYL